MDKRAVILFAADTTEMSSDSSTSDENWSVVSSVTSNDTSIDIDEEDQDDILFHPLMHYLIRGRRRHRITDFLHTVRNLDCLEFQEHFRMTRYTAYQLIEELDRSNFISHNPFGMTPITAEISFLIFLWFMANTEPLRTISNRFDVSISSVFRVIRRVISWILTKLDDVISWPRSDDEIMRICHGFYQKKQISNVIGAIDCTHIRIEKPANNRNDYCNRKKYFSIHLQAVVDSNLRFINVYCGEPGSLHDARVLKRSELWNTAIENPQLIFPRNTFLLGDSAYPLLSWLVPPFRDNGNLTAQQTEFNFVHSSTRMSIEKAFGVCKGRFRRIKFFTEYRNIAFITRTVVAACILHNYCINENDTYEIDEIDADLIEDNVQLEPIHNHGQLDRRILLFQEMFPDIRDFH